MYMLNYLTALQVSKLYTIKHKFVFSKFFYRPVIATER